MGSTRLVNALLPHVFFFLPIENKDEARQSAAAEARPLAGAARPAAYILGESSRRGGLEQQR